MHPRAIYDVGFAYYIAIFWMSIQELRMCISKIVLILHDAQYFHKYTSFGPFNLWSLQCPFLSPNTVLPKEVIIPSLLVKPRYRSPVDQWMVRSYVLPAADTILGGNLMVVERLQGQTLQLWGSWPWWSHIHHAIRNLIERIMTNMNPRVETRKSSTCWGKVDVRWPVAFLKVDQAQPTSQLWTWCGKKS